MMHTKHDIGKIGEKMAVRHLRRNGYHILKKNLHIGRNELDIIAKNKEYIAFVEVKTRSFDAKDLENVERPSAAVDAGKRTRTLQAAREYLRAHATSLCPRLDVIEVYLSRDKKPKLLKLHHIEGAFNAFGKVR